MTNSTDGARRRALDSLATFAAHAPRGSQMLRWMGLERRRSRAARAAASLGWFGAGVTLGGGIALLLAPSSGPELRRKLGRQAQRARKAVTEATNGTGRAVRPTP
jgi:hypothetical protein